MSTQYSIPASNSTASALDWRLSTPLSPPPTTVRSPTLPSKVPPPPPPLLLLLLQLEEDEDDEDEDEEDDEEAEGEEAEGGQRTTSIVRSPGR